LGLTRFELVRARREADRCLLYAEAGAPTSSAFAWRIAELTSDRERRGLAASLRDLVDDLSSHRLPGAAPVNRTGVRPYADLLRALVDRLERRDLPVTAKGMLLVRELLSNGDGPLYLYGDPDDLPAELEGIHDALDGR